MLEKRTHLTPVSLPPAPSIGRLRGTTAEMMVFLKEVQKSGPSIKKLVNRKKHPIVASK
jgi:hypothetical protein